MPRLAVTPSALVPLIWDELAAPAGLEPWNEFPVSQVEAALRRLWAFDADSLRVGLRVYLAQRGSVVRGSDWSHRSPSGWASFMERRS